MEVATRDECAICGEEVRPDRQFQCGINGCSAVLCVCCATAPEHALHKAPVCSICNRIMCEDHALSLGCGKVICSLCAIDAEALHKAIARWEAEQQYKEQEAVAYIGKRAHWVDNATTILNAIE